jgi:hypothetical protein
MLLPPSSQQLSQHCAPRLARAFRPSVWSSWQCVQDHGRTHHNLVSIGGGRDAGVELRVDHREPIAKTGGRDRHLEEVAGDDPGDGRAGPADRIDSCGAGAVGCGP